MPDIEELIVAVKPEGLSETEEGLESVSESSEEAAENMEEQSAEMGGFAEKFQGAMDIAIGALSVASAGLLSQVPVIGEAMQGLFSVVEAVAFQMDQVLRPVLSPITELFFNLSDAIFGLEGPVGSIVGIVSTLGATLGGIVGIVAGINSLFGTSFSVFAAFSGIAGKVASVLGVIGGVLGISATGVGALIAAVAGLVAVWQTDFLGIKTKVISALQTIWGWVQDLGSVFLDLANQARDGLIEAFIWLRDTGKNLIQTGVALIIDKVKDVFSFFTDDLPGLAKDGIDFLVSGISNKVEDVKEAAGDIADGILDKIPTFGDMLDVGKNIIDGLIRGISDALSRLKSAATDIGGSILDGIGGGLDAVGSGLGDLSGSVGGSVGTAGSVGLSSTGSNSRRAQYATTPDRVNIIEVDGQVLGRTTSKRQRDTTARRNIDG